MMAVLQYAVIAAAGLSAVGTIAVTVIPKWRRIADTLSGRPFQPEARDHWRQVHIEADRRKPFSKIRAASPRRGLLDRRSPH